MVWKCDDSTKLPKMNKSFKKNRNERLYSQTVPVRYAALSIGFLCFLGAFFYASYSSLSTKQLTIISKYFDNL